MKKLNLLVVSALMALGLTACGGDPAESTSSPETPTTSETTSEAPVVDYAALAAEAFGYVSAPYDAFSNGIGADQDLAPTCTAQNVTFQIRYTVSAVAAANLALSAEGDKLLVTQDMEEHAYVKALKAEVLHEGTVVLTKEYNVKVGKLASIASLYSAADGTIVTTVGKVVRVRSDGNGFHMADGDHAIYVYRGTLPEGGKVGDTVKVAGELDIYNGIYEIKNATVEATKTAVTDPVTLELQNQEDMTANAIVSREATITKGYLVDIGGFQKTASNGEKYICIEATVVNSKNKSFLIHAEDRKMSEEDFASWGFTLSSDGQSGTFSNPKLKKGSAITAHGFVDFYGGKAQLGFPVLDTVEDWSGEVPSIPEPTVAKKSVSELLKMGDKNIVDKAFEVTGILEGKSDTDDYGNGFLTDPETLESIRIYGNTTTASALAWNTIDSYSYSNPKDGKTSLADVHNGEEVTMKVLYQGGEYNSPRIVAVTTAHKASTKTYTAEVVKNETCDVTLSKTEGIAYGEEITITATPKVAGHAVSKIEITDAFGNVTRGDAKTMKFKATCVNKVSVTCEAVDLTKLKFTVDDIQPKNGSYADNTAVLRDATIEASQVGNYGEGIQMRYKSVSSMFFNTTAFEKAIASIKIEFAKPLTKANMVVETATTAFTKDTVIDEAKVVTPVDGQATYVIDGTTDAKFFRVAHIGSKVSGTFYIASVTINYVV